MTRSITALVAVATMPLFGACGESGAEESAAAAEQGRAAVSSAALEGGAGARPQSVSQDETWNFDDVAPGSMPTSWKAEQTNPRGEDAQWSVQQSATAASGDQVLELTDTRGATGSTFNLAWTDQVQFQVGRIEVKVKAGTGEEDQGGGPIWRVQDKDNYYIARWNPLEDNFRLYYVQDGHRSQLESADADLSVDAWHTIVIEHQGNRITAYLDGETMFETTDDTFSQAGGVGVWTKADAATMFDDLVMTAGGA